MTDTDSGIALVRASALVDLGRFEQAAQQLATFLATSPHNSHALCLLARARLGLNDDVGAEAAAEAAIAADPNNEWAFRISSVALQRMDQPYAAVRMARSAVQLAPHLADGHARVALALASARIELDEARRAAERAVALAPHLIDAYLAVGAVALADRRRADARAAYEHALAIDPTSATAHNELARVQLHRRRLGNGAGLAAAAGGFATALRSDPNQHVSRRNLDIVLHVFLARLAYYVFLVAFFGSHITTGTRARNWALCIPAGALLLPGFFAVRFLERLTPPLRQYLWRSLRAPLRGIATTALAIAAVILLFDGLIGGVFGGPAAAAAKGAFEVSVVLSLIARLVVYLERRRKGFTKPRRPKYTG